MKKILVIKLWALGDILMATPLLRALKSQFPDCSISWLVDSSYSEILADNELIDDIIKIDWHGWQKEFRRGNLVRYIVAGMSLRKKLRAKGFDYSICLIPDKWWSFWFLTARMNVGVFPTHNPGYLARYYTKWFGIPADGRTHNTDRALKAMDALGFTGTYDRRMVLSIATESDSCAIRFIADCGLSRSSRPFIVLHPGASQETKCWPTVKFAELADRLASNYDLVITGSAEELPLAKQIVEMVSPSTAIVIAAGRLGSIGETAALVKRSAAVVTGDTSMLHIASAQEIPIVAIYGSTRPNENTPLFGRNALVFASDIACSPCLSGTCRMVGPDYLSCQKSISADSVYRRLIELMQVVQIDGS